MIIKFNKKCLVWFVTSVHECYSTAYCYRIVYTCQPNVHQEWYLRLLIH